LRIIFKLGAKEFFVRKLMVSYGYDRDNAEKMLEIMKYQEGHTFFCKSPTPNAISRHTAIALQPIN
jgi:hypothetical protein